MSGRRRGVRRRGLMRVRSCALLGAAVVAVGAASSALAGASAPTPSNGTLAYTAVLSASQLYQIRADGTGPRRLATNPYLESEPIPSPDGTKIAFISSRGGQTDIYVMGSDGSAATRLTDDPSYDFDPAWSPDGTRIVFSSGRDGNSELYVVTADGTGVTRLTTRPWQRREPGVVTGRGSYRLLVGSRRRR